MNPFGDNLKLIAALENIDKEFTEDGDEDDHEDSEDDGMVWHVNENGERILLEVQNDILFYNNTQGIKGSRYTTPFFRPTTNDVKIYQYFV